MTIQNALQFIRRGQQDRQLRHRLVQAEGKAARDRILYEAGLRFSDADFQEAYSLALFKCQEAGEAEALMAFRMWWHLLIRHSSREQQRGGRPEPLQPEGLTDPRQEGAA